jgi:hypothetical protein
MMAELGCAQLGSRYGVLSGLVIGHIGNEPEMVGGLVAGRSRQRPVNRLQERKACNVFSGTNGLPPNRQT